MLALSNIWFNNSAALQANNNRRKPGKNKQNGSNIRQ